MPGARLPIVYIRGYAGGTSGIEQAVTDPFYGFNEGSTHVRVGFDDAPVFYQFESPLLRLHLDEGYQILVDGGQMAYLDSHHDIPPESIWIHRFYDTSSGTWGDKPQQYRLEAAALDLLALIEKLQERTGAPRVHLVAHSMGGLIARCLLQKTIPDERPGRRPGDYVDKLFTYGTPHGGITFDVGLGLFEKVRDTLGVDGSDVFGPHRMYEYLTPRAQLDPDGPGEDWHAREMPDGPDAFPRERVFCLVGTDPTDYDVAHGLSAAAVGASSDGLVRIENAQVPGAHRAYVHRSHSGRYGLVNSEEGYQNLRRFLFGDLRVDAALTGLDVTAEEDVRWQAEVKLSVRGLVVVTHEQVAAHWCPIQLPPTAGGATVDVPLTSTFLSTGLSRPEGADTLRYALHLRLLSLRQHHGLFRFLDHLEQAADFDDILIIDVGTDDAGRPATWAAWNSVSRGAIRDHRPTGAPIGDEDPAAGAWLAHIRLPSTTCPILGPDARLRLSVSAWN
ncbi:esterase/lipase family protein [Kitasatospora sp. NPDC057015]|uniref:esterase/lipase family protein n=1 Tax=Kitasatospora sp. NPDC057015 TaxID=3346001 RepID=UPI003631CDD9